LRGGCAPKYRKRREALVTKKSSRNWWGAFAWNWMKSRALDRMKEGWERARRTNDDYYLDGVA